MASMQTGISLDPGILQTLFTQGFEGIPEALVAIAAVLASLSIVITVVRGYLSPGKEKIPLSLSRVLRIALFASLIAFLSWGFTGLVSVMGFGGN